MCNDLDDTYIKYKPIALQNMPIGLYNYFTIDKELPPQEVAYYNSKTIKERIK